MFTAFTPVTMHRSAPRAWFESSCLSRCGFEPGTPYNIQFRANGLSLIASALGERIVSSRTTRHRRRPVIDLNSYRSLGELAEANEVRLRGSFGRLDLAASVRAAAILRARMRPSTFRVIDFCCGGGTASAAFRGLPYNVVAGVDMETAYLEEFATHHPAAELILADLRGVHHSDLPEFDGAFFGLPCTEHSGPGRARKGLGGKAELGGVGDLYLSALALIAARLPLFFIFENVPSFGASLAGLSLVAHLRKLGYHINETVLDGRDYGQISPRRRWFAVGCLVPGFAFGAPQPRLIRSLDAFLDPVDADADRADAERIARTIDTLAKHCERHAAMGNRFTLNVVDRDATELPAILKTYHKINTTGVYLRTPYGPRMFRPAEVCRIQGHEFNETDPTTIYQMSGQGVQSDLVREAITRPLAKLLA